jgi:hypothetical protein
MENEIWITINITPGEEGGWVVNYDFRDKFSGPVEELTALTETFHSPKEAFKGVAKAIEETEF